VHAVQEFCLTMISEIVERFDDEIWLRSKSSEGCNRGQNFIGRTELFHRFRICSIGYCWRVMMIHLTHNESNQREWFHPNSFWFYNHWRWDRDGQTVRKVSLKLCRRLANLGLYQVNSRHFFLRSWRPSETTSSSCGRLR
jgi:hypothetical protein